MRAWSIEELTEAADLAVLSEGVTQFGRSQAIGGNARSIACLLREDRHVVAGGSGRTEFCRLFINYLWVTESLRLCRNKDGRAWQGGRERAYSVARL